MIEAQGISRIEGFRRTLEIPAKEENEEMFRGLSQCVGEVIRIETEDGKIDGLYRVNLPKDETPTEDGVIFSVSRFILTEVFEGEC